MIGSQLFIIISSIFIYLYFLFLLYLLSKETVRLFHESECLKALYFLFILLFNLSFIIPPPFGKLVLHG